MLTPIERLDAASANLDIAEGLLERVHEIGREAAVTVELVNRVRLIIESVRADLAEKGEG